MVNEKAKENAKEISPSDTFIQQKEKTNQKTR